MDLVFAFVLGGLCGWVLGRLGRRSETTTTGHRRGFRPNKRQRKILAALPPDPERPTIDDLVREEAADLGVDTIPGAPEVALPVRLVVWKRDRPGLGDCAQDSLRFVVAEHVEQPAARADDVRLECRSPDDSG